ncbi:MAG: hypothetical protein HY235_20530 [Acidobacteria bacterium]|nr:hypothetical protein [Acidobacteriota bacterium]
MRLRDPRQAVDRFERLPHQRFVLALRLDRLSHQRFQSRHAFLAFALHGCDDFHGLRERLVALGDSLERRFDAVHTVASVGHCLPPSFPAPRLSGFAGDLDALLLTKLGSPHLPALGLTPFPERRFSSFG